jgi:hypothetical protein
MRIHLFRKKVENKPITGVFCGYTVYFVIAPRQEYKLQTRVGTDCFTTVPLSRKMSAGWLGDENRPNGQIPLKILGYRALKLTAG